jgi:hypothetical protein
VNGRRRRLAIGVAAVLLLLGPAAARAQEIYIAPSSMRTLWFRLGFTSEKRWLFGLSGDWKPWTAGVELSPHSAVGLMRAFVGAKAGVKPAVGYTDCSHFVQASGAAVAAFGPRQDFHIGLQLGAYFERLSWWSTTPTLPYGNASAKTVGDAESLSYRFSWFPGTAHLHDGSAALGLVFPGTGGYCGSD